MSARDTDLFGNLLPDRFIAARERYGVWPVTVWDVDHQDKMMQELKRAIADTGEARVLAATLAGKAGVRAAFKKNAAGKQSLDKREYASIFNPAVGTWILNLWAPEQGQVWDPFAGGGARAILTTKRGLDYTGVELREDECHAVYARCQHNGIRARILDSDGNLVRHATLPEGEQDPEAGLATIVNADARRSFRWLAEGSFDFSITCPPYWTLESYSDDPDDLSNAELPYGDFLLGLEVCIEEEFRLLRKGATSCWVVGLTRSADGNLKPLHHDIARHHRKCGFYFGEEVVLAMRNTGSVRRVGGFERGQRHLIRTHEYVLVHGR